MTKEIRDLLFHLAASEWNVDLPERGVTFLEDMLLDSQQRKEHIDFVQQLCVPPRRVTQLEICDIMLHGLRCQDRAVLIRLLFNPSALEFIANMINGFLVELLQSDRSTCLRT